MKHFINKLLIIAFLSICCISFSQNSSHGGKLPWINGKMPRNYTNGDFKMIETQSSSVSEGLKLAKQELIKEVLSKKGVLVSNSTVSTSNYNKKGKDRATGSITHHEETKIKSGKHEIFFSKVDHYYEYKNNSYKLWVLYVVSDKGPISSLPILSYKVDNGAWRSFIVPGWSQFYSGQTGKGILFLGGTAGFLGGGAYFLNKASYNDTRALEANSVKIKQEYRKRSKNFKNYGYIAMGAAAGMYIYNVIDALTSKKGKMKYDYKNMKYTIAPSTSINNDGVFLAGINVKF